MRNFLTREDTKPFKKSVSFDSMFYLIGKSFDFCNDERFRQSDWDPGFWVNSCDCRRPEVILHPIQGLGSWVASLAVFVVTAELTNEFSSLIRHL